MRSFARQDRAEWLSQMESEGVDVLVVGGGITGAAVAMDAAVRGYRVGLVEKGDFACGTSSKSTCLAHGGIRYLPQFDFPMVHEALVERGLLFRNAPWIVEPLAFVLPLYAWNRRPLGTPFVPPLGIGLDLMVDAGLTLYDGLAGGLNIRRHQRLSMRDARRRAPALRVDGWKHAFVYYDGRTDDVRLTLAVLKTAVGHGARAVNYASVTGFEIADGQIRAATVRDELSGAVRTVRARHVVNAGGVFAQRVEELTGLPSHLMIEPAKGVHLVLPGAAIPMTDHAVVLPETDDERLLFLIPQGGRVLVGTTDTAGGDIDHATTSDHDVDYLIRHCNRYLERPIAHGDVIGTYAGYRPLVRTRGGDEATSARLSRSHAVLDGPAGMVSVVGGKLTTWRRMGEDAMNHVARRDGRPESDATRTTALVGGEPIDEEALADLPDGVSAHLVRAYGPNAGEVAALVAATPTLAERIAADLPYILAEVVYACRQEMAVHLEDVLARRMKAAVEASDNGLESAGRVARVMAAELGWDAADMGREIDAYRAAVARDYHVQTTFGSEDR